MVSHLEVWGDSRGVYGLMVLLAEVFVFCVLFFFLAMCSGELT